MTNDLKIVELMSVETEGHDIDWLKKSLQAAIKFEFSTLPPYLTAMWSIKDNNDSIYKSIQEIVREEMSHMSIMCNLLSALGGTPKLNTEESVPAYPGPLPGGINPQLTIPLQGLSHKALKLFMDIEYPEEGPIAIANVESYPTIGAFYSAIIEAFEKLNPPLIIENQLEGPLGLTKLSTLQDVRNAVEFIVRQGEGSNVSPDDMGPGDLAHYYRFAEVFYGRKLQKNVESGEWKFDGAPIKFPEVWPMAEVPLGGHLIDDVLDVEIKHLIEQFDQNFTKMLNHLQASWQYGNQNELSKAIGSMFTLRSPAVSLMQKSLPTGMGNYGPCWRAMNNEALTL